jgi:hypothetical protein
MKIYKTIEMKYSLSLIFYLCLLSVKMDAQIVNKTIVDEYSPAIVTRVYDVVSKVDISDSTQKILAALFEEQDRELLRLIKENKSKRILDSVRMDLQEDWLNVLTAKQQYYYSIAVDKERSRTKYWFTQFSFALQKKDTIKLSEAQADSMFLHIDTLNKMKNAFKKKNPGQWFESKSYESEVMTRLLTDGQYTKLLTLKNTEKAKNNALADWKDLEVRNLTGRFNKEIELQRLTEYYIEKQNVFDRYAHNKIKQSAMLKYVYDNKPKVLNVLSHARRNPKNNTQGLEYKF